MLVVIYLLITVLVVWHIYGAAMTSWYIATSSLFDPWQKKAQYVIAWCVPILGVAIILHLLGPVVRQRRPGWIPLLESVILASFGLSVSQAITPSIDSGNPMTQDDVRDTNSDASD